MNLELIRKNDTGISCTGELYLDGVFVCYTVEDSTLLGTGKGCGIAEGAYRVVYTLSPRYKKRMLRLVGVPNREGILIHVANRASDVIGCIGVGLTLGKDFVGRSQTALEKLEGLVLDRMHKGEQLHIIAKRP